MNVRPSKASPRVSVIVPVYNAAATLTTAVESVLRQSLTELEVLIVDDASEDHSVAVAYRLAEQDARVRVLRSMRNCGQSAARNLALRVARGTWVTPVDADDEITEQRLEHLCDAGDAAGADLIADGVRFVGPQSSRMPHRLGGSRTSRQELETLTLEVLIRSDIPLNGVSSLGYLKPLIRRAFLERWRLFYDERLRFAEDLNLYARTLLCGARFVLHPHTYYLYNQTPVSASRDVRALPKVASHALVNNERLRCLAQHWNRDELEPLLEEHHLRWSTVLWFNQVKLAVRDSRFADASRLFLNCPSGVMDVLRFARDRMRTKYV
jgi:glycosyltransferase involved in cell wall biosynthesis